MAFPTVALLDSFKRANEAPLSNGGKWVLINGMGFTGKVEGEGYDGKSAAPTEDGAYWSVREFVRPGVIAEFAEVLGAGRSIFLWACLSSPGTVEKSGYRLRIEETKGVPLEFLVRLERIDKSAATTLVSKTKVIFAVGDLFAISVQEGKVIAWHKAGAGALTSVVEAADATYTEGFVGIGRIGNLGKVRNLEAGGDHTHTLTASQGQTASVAHSSGRALAASQAQAASLGTAPQRVLRASQSQTALLTAVIASHEHNLSASQPQAVTLRRDLSRTLRVSAASTASLSAAGSRLRTLFATVFSEATLTAVIETPPPPPPPPISVGAQSRSAVVHNLISTR